MPKKIEIPTERPSVVTGDMVPVSAWNLVRCEKNQTRDNLTLQSLWRGVKNGRVVLVRTVVRADPYPVTQGASHAELFDGSAWQMVWNDLDANVRHQSVTPSSRNILDCMREDAATLLDIVWELI